jgi:hypothetical protein
VSDINERIRHNSQRIDSLENDVGDIRVEMGKAMVTMEHESKSHTERYQHLSTQSIELKEIIAERIKRDEQRELRAEEYRRKREQIEAAAQALDAETRATRQKWIQGLLTPQTIILIIAIFLSLMGSRVADVMEIAAVVGTPMGVSETINAE